MIRVKLREVMAAYQARTGERLTYESLALKTGLKASTVHSLGSRPNYNTRLSTIDKLCEVLGCELEELIERVPNEPPR